MTRKDYELVAMIVKHAMLSFRDSGKVINEDRADAISDFFTQHLVKGLVVGFKMTYENFDSEKFITATLPDDI